MGNFCPTWLTSVSLSAQGQWWPGVGTLEAPVFLGQSTGGWSPLNYPAAVQLPLCPLAAFHLSPKSGVTQSSPSETSWVTQARWLLSVAQGPGQRCHHGCLQWDGQGEGQVDPAGADSFCPKSPAGDAGPQPFADLHPSTRLTAAPLLTGCGARTSRKSTWDQLLNCKIPEGRAQGSPGHLHSTKHPVRLKE